MQLFIYLFALRVGGEDRHTTYFHKEKNLRWHTFEMPCFLLLQKREEIWQGMGIWEFLWRKYPRINDTQFWISSYFTQFIGLLAQPQGPTLYLSITK